MFNPNDWNFRRLMQPNPEQLNPGLRISPNLDLSQLQPDDSEGEDTPAQLTDNRAGGTVSNKTPLSLEDRLAFLNKDTSGPAAKKFRDYLDTAPVNNGPGKITRIGAALTGAAEGIKDPAKGAIVAQELKDAPFQEQYKNWLQGGAGLEKSAELEDKEGKERVSILKQMMDEDKQGKKDDRQAKLDDSTIAYRQAQIDNFKSLKEQRDKQGWTFHQDKVSGHLIGLNPNLPDGQNTKDYGVMDLTPQQKEDLKVNTFGQEEGVRQKNRVSLENQRQGNKKSLFDYTQPQKAQSAIEVHQANRNFDVNNPLQVRAPRDSYVIPSQQVAAEKQAAKELNIENKGAYKDLIEDDGSLVKPGGSYFSSADPDKLLSFQKLVKERAAQILEKKRGGLSVNPPGKTKTTPGGRTIEED